jgi:hypothetical protein
MLTRSAYDSHSKSCPSGRTRTVCLLGGIAHMKTKYTLKTILALIIRAVGLVAIVIGLFLLWHWFMAEVFPYLLGRRPHNSVGFGLFRDAGAALTVFGIACRLVARRLLTQRVTANETGRTS